jgi:tRNA1Val (adenine37-N6)-methyltransferase
MNKNPDFTYNYFQPMEYRFSLDSVFLAKKIGQHVNKNPREQLQVLDLCAGCGIIGLELSIHSKIELKIDFLEIQEIYLSFFNKNVEMIYPNQNNNSERFKFIHSNYTELLAPAYKETYDLILCNPPYFFKGEGLLSPSEFKNRCRFFLDSDFENLILAILHSLKLGSSAYLLVRSGIHHGREPLKEITRLVSPLAEAFIFDNIRGTDIIEIRKKAI